MALPSYEEYLQQHAATKQTGVVSGGSGGGSLVNEGRALENQLKAYELEQKLRQSDPAYLEQQATAKARAEAAAAKYKPAAKPKLSAVQLDALAAGDTTLEQLGKLEALLQDRKLDTGRSQLAKGKLRAVLGPTVVKTNDKELEFDAVANQIKANFIKAISGAAASDREVERLSKFLPALTDTRQELQAKLKALRENVTASTGSLKKQAKTYDVGTGETPAPDPLGIR